MRQDAEWHARIERVLSGALRLWAVAGSVERDADCFLVRTESGMKLRIAPAMPRGWTVFHEADALGVHAGLPGLLRQLREELAPHVAAGRLVIGAQPLL